MQHLNRRRFLQTTAATAAAASTFTILRPARGFAANDKLRTAHIGVGGMGSGDLSSVASHKGVQVVALCDIDAKRLEDAGKRFPDAKRFADFRKLFDELADQVDAVVVSTPDHTHAPASMTAMNLGKHVYCQKPLTHEVYEARRLREISEQKKLVTQMGIQVHGSHQYRQATAMIQGGAIGKVREVHAWSDKDWGHDGGPLPVSGKVPEGVSWDLWLGVTPEIPYTSGLHPFNWRRYITWGTGTLGDMGVHIFDTPYRALKLTAPLWAKTTCRPPTGIGHPTKNKVEYEFPGTEYTTDKLRWFWYDGDLARQKDLQSADLAGVSLPGQGSVFIGEKGSLLLPHVADPVLLPKEKFTGYKKPEVSTVNHYHQWVDGCLTGKQADASFSYAGPLTEALLLGVVANRFPGEQLQWDAKNLKVTNLSDANALLRREYRKGFEVENL